MPALYTRSRHTSTFIKQISAASYRWRQSSNVTTSPDDAAQTLESSVNERRYQQHLLT